MLNFEQASTHKLENNNKMEENLFIISNIQYETKVFSNEKCFKMNK